MTFQWPTMLWTLALLPLLVLLYLWVLKRRRKTTVRLASVQVARLALGKGPGWRRHVPPVLLLLSLAALLFSVSRPMATITLPIAERTIMLAMDVSGSMRAEDVKPNRLVASQEAAKAFVEWVGTKEFAELYSNDVQYELKTLSQQIEPILIVSLGVLVLILALGIFLPMWDLGKVALKR